VEFCSEMNHLRCLQSLLMLTRIEISMVRLFVVISDKRKVFGIRTSGNYAQMIKKMYN
jgi:hypothetical protein